MSSKRTTTHAKGKRSHSDSSKKAPIAKRSATLSTHRNKSQTVRELRRNYSDNNWRSFAWAYTCLSIGQWFQQLEFDDYIVVFDSTNVTISSPNAKSDLVTLRLSIGNIPAGSKVTTLTIHKTTDLHVPKDMISEMIVFTLVLANEAEETFILANLVGKIVSANDKDGIEAASAEIRQSREESLQLNKKIAASSHILFKEELPAGEYWIGDPCYACPDKFWMDLLEATMYFSDANQTFHGHPLFCHSTRHGDGTFHANCDSSLSNQDQTLDVDSGNLGALPMELIDHLNSQVDEKERIGRKRLAKRCGMIVKYDAPFVATAKNGEFTYGKKVHVQTSNE